MILWVFLPCPRSELSSKFSRENIAQVITINRSSHSEVFLRKGVLKICSKFTGEHPCRSAISISFIEIALRHGCSPATLLHIFRTPFPRRTPLSGCFWIKETLLNLMFGGKPFLKFLLNSQKIFWSFRWIQIQKNLKQT